MLLVRLSALAGFIGPLLYAVVAVYLGVKDPGFSFLMDWAGELGARGAPYAYWYNTLAVIPLGACLVLFSVAFWRAFRPGKRALLSSLLLILVGVLCILMAVFPCDAGCATRNLSRTAAIQMWLYIVAYPMLVLLPGIIGLRIRKRCELRGYYGFSIATFVLLALGYVLLAVNFIGAGAIQSAFLIAFIYWILITARIVWVELAAVKTDTQLVAQ